VPVSDIGLQFAHRLVRRALGSEAVAVGVEVGFPLRLHDLRNGLLDESVQHAGYDQHLLAAIRFWNLHSTQRQHRSSPEGQHFWRS
jgi:hypothetical protein